MSMINQVAKAYVRRMLEEDIEVGDRIELNGREGTVTYSDGYILHVLLDGHTKPILCLANRATIIKYRGE